MVASHAQPADHSPHITRDTIQILCMGFEAEQLRDAVTSLEEDGHRCHICEDIEAAAGALRDPRTLLLMIGMSAEDISQWTERVRTENLNAAGVPIMACFREPSPAMKEEWLPPDQRELLLHEIDDFLLAPLSLHDLRLRVHRLTQRFTETEDAARVCQLNLMSELGMQRFIGKSPAFMAAIEKIPRVAACDATVLLTGDTGTGKEMCARAIHYLSPRANNPFIPINCGSIPHDLFENEMFGHEVGAFTDARQARRGLVAEAELGTLFLDEVDSLPLSAQAKLLRFLQDRQYRPLGASGYRHSNTRLLAASNQNLHEKVRAGSFREDLYYRLKVVSLGLPKLHDRRDDILPLASHFLQTAAREYRRPVAKLSGDAGQKLLSYHWPGNVRELENVIRHAVVFADGPALRASDLQLPTDFRSAEAQGREPFKVAKVRVIEEFERTYLNEVIAACGGNISLAAREAKKDRRSFFGLLKKYALTTNSARLRGA